MNKIKMSGFLYKVGELHDNNSAQYIKCVLAIRDKDKKDIQFFDLVAFNEEAEKISDFHKEHKKAMIKVEGKLKKNVYTSIKDNTRRSFVEVLINKVDLFELKQDKEYKNEKYFKLAEELSSEKEKEEIDKGISKDDFQLEF
ncbi:single-stranded DNA-binding protein [[Mycoplasma] anseris]|nr:single-stranded DNA-binding protein [[Mycoplasma] anseris]